MLVEEKGAAVRVDTGAMDKERAAVVKWWHTYVEVKGGGEGGKGGGGPCGRNRRGSCSWLEGRR